MLQLFIGIGGVLTIAAFIILFILNSHAVKRRKDPVKSPAFVAVAFLFLAIVSVTAVLGIIGVFVL